MNANKDTMPHLYAGGQSNGQSGSPTGLNLMLSMRSSSGKSPSVSFVSERINGVRSSMLSPIEQVRTNGGIDLEVLKSHIKVAEENELVFLS
jgi:hypothetical protein